MCPVFYFYSPFVDFTTVPELEPSASCPLPDPLCRLLASKTNIFLATTALWAALQLSWTIILLAAQLWQVSRQMTSLEVSNVGRYGFMGGRGVIGTGQMGAQQGGPSRSHSHSHGQGESSPLSASQSLAQGLHSTSHSHPQSLSGSGGLLTLPCRICSICASCPGASFLLRITGLDRFTARGGATRGLAVSAAPQNPFDLGPYLNCMDFWGMGKEVGVRWETCYDIPEGGFKKAREERLLDERERGDRGELEPSNRKGGRRFWPGVRRVLSMRMGRSSTYDYEPLAQV